MQKVYLVLIMIAQLFFACNKEKTASINYTFEEIKIDNTFNFRFNDRFDLSHYIPLETNSNSLISTIIKIIVTDKIYIQDQNEKIFIFTLNGKFINKIDFKGNGPKEYTSISDFSVKDSLISILDTNEKKIITYHLNGDFIKKQKTLLEILYIDKIGDYDLWYTGNIGCDLNYDKKSNQFHKLLFSKENRIEAMFSPFKPKSSGYVYRTQTPFYQYNGINYFIEPINDTIYRIEKNVIEPIYVVDFGKHKRPENFLEETPPEDVLSTMIKNSYIRAITSFYDFSDIIYFKAYIGKERKHVIYDKINKQSIMSASITDEKNNIPVKPISYSGEPQYLMSVLTPDDIRESNVYGLNLKVNEEDNPIIFLYKHIITNR